MFNHSGAELGEKISRDSSTLGNLIPGISPNLTVP